MHDPRVLLDPATDAVRKLARRGYALDVAALEKLLSARNGAIHRGDEARAFARETSEIAARVDALADRIDRLDAALAPVPIAPLPPEALPGA